LIKSKIGITGGSFGGYLSYMALTKDADFLCWEFHVLEWLILSRIIILLKDRWVKQREKTA
jgi:hypothetical protein